MSVNEIHLTRASAEAANISGNRLLGIMGMIGAPMLLIETILRMINVLPSGTDNAWVGFVEMFYIGGWIALAVGMRRLRVAGNGAGSKIVFGLQMTGLVLAFLFTIQVMLGAGYDKPPVSLVFIVCDLGFPFSHLWMIVVGVMMWRAGVWRGWLRVAPFLVGGFLALLMAGIGAFVAVPQGALVFAILTAIGLFSLAVAVCKSGMRAV